MKGSNEEMRKVKREKKFHDYFGFNKNQQQENNNNKVQKRKMNEQIPAKYPP